ncbi:MAG: RDD family protein [Spirulinaceae cyanobacterium SM2_1_0]|nr:RDD family protein [Spirulinaceae cyanobacterium SM2_1_0]
MKWLNRIALRTPESVELEFALAGLGNRAPAYGIDLLASLLLLYCFLLLWRLVESPLIDLLIVWLGDSERVELWLLAIQIVAVFLIRSCYFVAFETLWQGQTPGKRVMRIRVVRDDGRSVGLPQAVLRSLLLLFDELFFLATFFIAYGRREKRLGDWVAGTLVVQSARAATPPLQVSDAAHALAQQLPKQANLARLTPDEFATIRSYLRRVSQFLPEARQEKGQQLAQSARQIIGLTAVPEGTTATQFLEAVYLAYQEQRLGDRAL